MDLGLKWKINKDPSGEPVGALSINAPFFVSIVVFKPDGPFSNQPPFALSLVHGSTVPETLQARYATVWDAMAAYEGWLYRELEKLSFLVEQVNKGYMPRTADEIRRSVEG